MNPTAHVYHGRLYECHRDDTHITLDDRNQHHTTATAMLAR